MISSVSPSTFYSISSVQTSTIEPVGAQKTLQSQTSVPVIDTSKFQPPPSSQSDTSANSVNQRHSVQSSEDMRTAAPVESSAELSDEAKQVINQLRARDSEVRAHEQAHLSAAGGYATGGASYAYQVGPDGQRYAIGGEVGIDVSPIAGDPEATLLKANVVQRAALAPAEPSTQDMRVASAAMQMANQARVEIAAQSAENPGSLNKSNDSSGSRSVAVEEKLQDADSPLLSNPSLQTSPLQIDRNGFDLRIQLQQVS